MEFTPKENLVDIPDSRSICIKKINDKKKRSFENTSLIKRVVCIHIAHCDNNFALNGTHSHTHINCWDNFNVAAVIAAVVYCNFSTL